MTISVVIPAYNEEKLLPKTLTSLQSLARLPDEVIVVDGGSTDKTVDIARKLGAKVIPGKHDTIGYARQQGLLAAKGDVVAFTDADTLVPTDWLTKIENTLNLPNVSGVFGGYKVTSAGVLFYDFFINYINPILIPLSFRLGRPMPGGQNMAFWKDKAIRAGGFPVEFRSVEDFEIAKRLKTVGVIIFLKNNNVISSGRRGKEGVSMIFRVLFGISRYFLTGKAQTFKFPDIR